MSKYNKLILIAVIITSILVLAINWKTWFVYPKHYEIVKKHLKDPDSAKFRNSYFSNNGCFCGEFNAKNSSGGYVGFRRFAINVSSMSDNSATIEGTEIVGSGDAYIDVMDSEIEILKERKSRADRGEKLEYLSEAERKKKAISMAFEKTWSRDCVK